MGDRSRSSERKKKKDKKEKASDLSIAANGHAHHESRDRSRHRDTKEKSKDEKKKSSSEDRNSSKNKDSEKEHKKHRDKSKDDSKKERSSSKHHRKSDEKSSKKHHENDKENRHHKRDKSEKHQKENDLKNHEKERRKTEKAEEPALKTEIEVNGHEESDADDDYDDDFEDYEDDFDAGENDPMPSPSTSAAAEPRSLKALVKTQADAASSSKPPSAQSRFNFAQATVTQPIDYGVWSSVKRRGVQLQKLIELDARKLSLLSLAANRTRPTTAANTPTNSNQKTTQTGEELLDKECQTWATEVDVRWTQMPSCSQGTAGDEHGTVSFEASNQALSLNSLQHALHLSQFVKDAAQLIESQLLCDRAEERIVPQDTECRSQLLTGKSTFALGPLAKDATVTALCVSNTADHTFVAAFHVKESPLDLLNDSHILLCFDVSSPQPKHALASVERVTCCAMADSGNIVFAGCTDGALCAWDLDVRVSVEKEKQLPWQDSNIPLLAAAADTSLCDETCANHILQIAVEQVDTSTLTVSCLEERTGAIHVWSAFQSALTNFTGSALQLVKRSVVHTPLTGCTAQCFVSALPTGNYLVGCSNGELLSINAASYEQHLTRYANSYAVGGRVVSLDLNPFDPSVLLCGSADGSLSVYELGRSAQPLLTLSLTETSGVQLVAARFSHTKATLFYSLSSSADVSLLRVWDVSSGQPSEPIQLQQPASQLCVHSANQTTDCLLLNGCDSVVLLVTGAHTATAAAELRATLNKLA